MRAKTTAAGAGTAGTVTAAAEAGAAGVEATTLLSPMSTSSSEGATRRLFVTDFFPSTGIHVADVKHPAAAASTATTDALLVLNYHLPSVTPALWGRSARRFCADGTAWWTLLATSSVIHHPPTIGLLGTCIDRTRPLEMAKATFERCPASPCQGLTLVHFSAQVERFV